MDNWESSVPSMTLPCRQHPGSRAEMEARLTPLIRCVLRTGAGVPALVQWVRQTLPHLPSADIEQTAPQMARLLSAQLLRQGHRALARRSPALETVVG